MNVLLPILAVAATLATMPTSEPKASPKDPKNLYDFTMKDIDGKDVKLSQFKGKVILVVNVASQCGFTPQYEGLQKTFAQLKDKGFVILGFPANQFGGQEPGTDKEIKQFCTGKYNVTFPMFSKITVKGDDMHPLYHWLIASSDRPKDDIEWNFTKFVIDRHGNVVHRFKPQVKPESDEVMAVINEQLAKK